MLRNVIFRSKWSFINGSNFLDEVSKESNGSNPSPGLCVFSVLLLSETEAMGRFKFGFRFEFEFRF